MISKNGIWNNTFIERLRGVFDTNYYTEPDGSTWIHIAHHNNPQGIGKFSQTNNFLSNLYIDKDRWLQISICNAVTTPIEFMVKQKTTSDATETKYRWIQNANPLTATYEQVASSTVTKITTSGYSNVSAAGGLYALKSSSYFVIANASKGNWFGAFGAWGDYNGGIPGYPNSGITTGYMDLYLRVDTDNKHCSITKNNELISNQIIEI